MSTDGVTRQALVPRLTNLIDGPLVAGYPTKNKIVELCLIGRTKVNRHIDLTRFIFNRADKETTIHAYRHHRFRKPRRR